MKHSILIDNKGSDSHWVSIDETDSFSSTVKSLETDNSEELANAILTEFKLTPEELKSEFKVKIISWLNEMEESDLESLESEKVRDFIYEMF